MWNEALQAGKSIVQIKDIIKNTKGHGPNSQEQEPAQITSSLKIAQKSDIIYIKIEDSHFYVQRNLLVQHKGTRLASFFGQQGQNEFYLDRNANSFRKLIEFLRHEWQNLHTNQYQ